MEKTGRDGDGSDVASSLRGCVISLPTTRNHPSIHCRELEWGGERAISHHLSTTDHPSESGERTTAKKKAQTPPKRTQGNQPCIGFWSPPRAAYFGTELLTVLLTGYPSLVCEIYLSRFRMHQRVESVEFIPILGARTSEYRVIVGGEKE